MTLRQLIETGPPLAHMPGGGALGTDEDVVSGSSPWGRFWHQTPRVSTSEIRVAVGNARLPHALRLDPKHTAVEVGDPDRAKADADELGEADDVQPRDD